MRSNVAIKIENLGKAYRLGVKEERHETMLSALAARIKSPFRNYRDVRNLTHFDSKPGDESCQTANHQVAMRSGLSDARSDVVWAVNDVSFEIKHGEAVGIIGRNGAGKSTLLKILSRITEPTCGRAKVFGRVGSLLEVGTGFHPDLTGRENTYLNGTILGMKKREVDRKFDEIVEFSGIEKFIDTPVKRYSSGMRVRLGFSVAAHLEPEILIIDEVLAVGDAEFQKKCLGKMGQVAECGRTVLFVSHNLTAVQSLCQRAIWLDQGSVVEDGSPTQVVARYLQTGERLTTERVWVDLDSAPGNSEVRLTGARVRSSDSVEFLNLHSQIRLEFDLLNITSDADLNLSYHLYGQDGIMVLNSVSIPRILPRGRHQYTCHIPENLLNDGMYSVELMVVKNSTTVLFKATDCLTFQVHDLERESAWFGKFPGAVRPKMQWTIEPLKNGVENISVRSVS